MGRPEQILPDKERDVLIAVYENPDMTFDTYTLTTHLNPKISPSAPEYAAAFKDTLAAIEELVVRGLVDGKQLKGADGVYYSKLTIKYKGKQVAIQARNQKAELEKVPDLLKVAEEIRNRRET